MSRMRLFLNDTRTTEIYTLPLHDALRIWTSPPVLVRGRAARRVVRPAARPGADLAPQRLEPAGQGPARRSEEHTSELQSRQYLVCRLLLEKKKTDTSRD